MTLGIWTIVGDHSHDILDHLGVERFDGFGHNDKKVYDGLNHLGVVDRFHGFGHNYKKVYDGLDHLGLGVVDR